MKTSLIKSTIRWKILLLFIAQIIIVLGVTGLYLSWYLRGVLEEELGAKLELAAASLAAQLDGELLLSLRPGDEDSRTFRNFQKRLRENRDATGVARVSVVNRQCHFLVDSEADVPIGGNHIRLEMDKSELNRVWAGHTASSVLFKGKDDTLFKSGYAPLYGDNGIVAALVIEGSARSLEAVAKLGGFLMRLGAVGALFALILTLLFSSRLIRPINQLRRSAEIIGGGNYTTPICVKGNDELAFLAHTMEEMRKGVVKRDTQLKAMLAGVAHEIRNPLGGIELFAGLLSDELSTPEQKERAQKILNEVFNLKAIVSDFLNYATPADAQRQRCDVADLLSEIHLLMKQELERHKTVMHWHTENLAVLLDPKHGKQIFLNLIKNSLQAVTNPGEIRVSAAQKGAQIEITISDNGGGIPEETRKRVFEPFFTTRESGTGLGLAIVRTLCEANHGSIALFSSDDHGSTFKLFFEKAAEG